MRRGLALALCCGVLLLSAFFTTPTLVDRLPGPVQELTVDQLHQQALAKVLPAFTAQALLLYDVDADRLLYEQNIAAALPPASLTKLMTALLVLEKGNLQEQVTVQGADLVSDSSMGLQVGETLRVEELLWGLLVASGNDAAMSLARHTAGTVDDFVVTMNQRAIDLGLTATHFVNPHGLDAEGQTISAADVLLLTQRNLTFPLFRQIVGTATTTVAGHRLRSTNELLGFYAGADGVKTGTTDAAGQCLVATITRNGHQAIIIVLGSQDRYADVQVLYAAYLANYVWANGQPNALSALNRLVAPDGTLWYLRTTGEAPSLLLERSAGYQLQAFRRLALPSSGTPWQSGQSVGTLEWRLGEQLIGTQPLILW